MATLSSVHPTLLDMTNRLDPKGAIDKIAEVLTQQNEILLDMTFVEGNLPTGHKTTVRTGLPAPTWRKLYGGVQPGKSTTAQITDSCGMLEAYAEIDKALADLSGNAMAFRASEDRAFLEGMNQEFAQTLFYGNEGTEPEAFTGFAPRYNSKASALNGENILVDGSGAATKLASVWLIGWGENTIHGIIPKGSIAGFQQKDLGEVTAGDLTTGYWQAYRTHYRWDVGLTVRDWRYAVRIQYDEATLTKNAASGADLIDLLIQAEMLIPSLSMCRPVFYGNRTFLSFLRRQEVAKIANSTMTLDNLTGRPVVNFDGIPVRRVDQLAVSEGTTRIS